MTNSTHLFEMKDETLRKMTFAFSGDGLEHPYVLEEINGMPVTVSEEALASHIRKIEIEDAELAKRYVRYQIEDVEGGAMIEWGHLEDHIFYPSYDEESKSVTFDIRSTGTKAIQ